jgi:6-phosphogluconolactonase (cycloisomerase 2 family)
MTSIYILKKKRHLKKQYNLKIKKGKTSRKLTVHPDGEIIAER